MFTNLSDHKTAAIIKDNSPFKWADQSDFPTTLRKHDKYGRKFSIRNAHMIRIVFVSVCGEWDGKEWAVQKINIENESHGQENQGLNTPECHSSA